MQGVRWINRWMKAGAATVIMVAALALPLIASAQAGNDALNRLTNVGNTVYGESSGQQNLPSIIGKVLQTAFGLIGVLLLLIIFYAGYLRLTAQGNEEKVKKSNTMLTNAAIGMVIIFVAFFLTDFVVKSIINKTTGQGSGQTPSPSGFRPP